MGIYKQSQSGVIPLYASKPRDVKVSLRDYEGNTSEIVFSVLRKVIETIHTKKLVGGQVLNLLHKHSNTGMPDVKARLTQLANQVLRVFYSQLVSWVSHDSKNDLPRIPIIHADQTR